MSGKGDDRRPTQVSDGEFESNWRRTFGRTTRRRGALERAARRIGQREMVLEPNAASASPQEAPCGWPGCSPDCDPENDHP